MRKTDPQKNENVVGEHLKFERKDVWDMKWADVSLNQHKSQRPIRAK